MCQQRSYDDHVRENRNAERKLLSLITTASSNQEALGIQAAGQQICDELQTSPATKGMRSKRYRRKKMRFIAKPVRSTRLALVAWYTIGNGFRYQPEVTIEDFELVSPGHPPFRSL